MCQKESRKYVAYSICALIMMLLYIMPVKAVDSGNYQYTDNADGTITITQYQGTESDVVIPDTLDGKKITAIGESAFATKDIVSVTIPAGITTIGKQAFRYCVNLQKVTFAGAGLTTVGQETFAYCKKLTECNLPETLTTVENQAFSNMDTMASYATNAITVTYGEDVFANTTVTKVICKQSSTTYSYLKKLAGKIEFSGPYLESLSGSVNVGATLQLELVNAQGEVTYTSSNEEVATVDAAGVITGLKAGKAKIQVSNAGEKITYDVTVKSLSISQKKATITAGFTKILKVKNAQNVTWSTSNAKVATVSAKGVVTAKQKGKATITAKVNSETYKCNVTVKENKATVAKYSTNAYSYGSGVLGFASIAKTKKGYVVKGHFINGTSNKIKGIKNLTLTVKAGGKVIAQKRVGTVKLNLGAKRTKALSFSFSGSQVKKKADLRKYSTISVNVSGAKYYYKQTITVPAN